MPAPIDMFISFVEEDDALREALEKHLAALRQDGLIHTWSSRRIAPGDNWRNAVDARLDTAQVILFLISADFLASDYCSDVELARAIRLERTGKARVILVSVRACDQPLEAFRGLDMLPRNRKAVMSWSNHDEAWADVARGLRDILQRLRGAQVTSPRPVPRYQDETVRLLSEELEAERKRKRVLQEVGVSTAELDEKILALRRQFREGGQLRAGDSLGDGRYLLLDRIGRGGFAIVWRALDREENEQVAIKVLHSEVAGDAVRRERFIRGARNMMALDHPAVVRVLQPHGEDGGYHYFVMELLQNGDLRRAVLEKRIVGEAVLPIILQVGDALAKVHAHGWVHRDVKPANILLDDAGAPKLADFDLVGDADTTGGTRTGAMGSLRYAAPEILDRPQDADARADVYGLGMTAVFGLFGNELPLAVMRNAAELIDDLACSASVRLVLSKAVEWEPVSRFADAASFCRALREAWASTETELPAPSSTSRTRVLFLGAEYDDLPRLGATREVTKINERLRRAEYGEQFTILQEWDARRNLQELLIKHTPDIVHFACRGTPDGRLVFVDDNGRSAPIEKENLCRLLYILSGHIKCVVLNASNSNDLARMIAEKIDCAIGFKGPLHDAVARAFAEGFYLALGHGRSVQEAFDLGCMNVVAEGYDDDESMPYVLMVREGAQAKNLHFANRGNHR